MPAVPTAVPDHMSGQGGVAPGALDPRQPVLVGVGTSSGSEQATELMTRALEAAAADAGGRGLLGSLDRIAVPQGSWSYPDPARLVADAVGADRAETHLVELGIPQQSLVNEALVAIASGRSAVAAVVGGEAKRWVRECARRGVAALETPQPGVQPDEVRRRQGPLLEEVEVAHRLWDPVQQYAMIDNALRASEHRSLGEHRREVSDLWERFNRVARDNPEAAFPQAMDADALATPTPGNRPLAFPYNKWHSTQWTVDQAAALVFCSVEAAVRAGIPSDRWVFPLVGLESSHAVSLLARAEPQSWPAMGVLGRAATARIGRQLAEIEVIELYSCFPAAVRVQQRELGLDLRGTPTVTGGMAFAGGPFNNFVLQSTAAVVRRLRAEPAALGMVTTVSGLLTKPGIGIWSCRPDGRAALVDDLAEPVREATGTLPVVETLDGYAGPATVATYTVTYEGLDPVRTVFLCDTPDGRRTAVVSGNPAMATEATHRDLIGCPVRLAGGSCTVD